MVKTQEGHRRDHPRRDLRGHRAAVDAGEPRTHTTKAVRRAKEPLWRQRFFFFYLSCHTALTPQTARAQSEKHCRRRSASSEWPEDQKRHRGRETRPPLFLFFNQSTSSCTGLIVGFCAFQVCLLGCGVSTGWVAVWNTAGDDSRSGE